jgi:DNA mismatch repair ATPase MutS
MFTSLYRCYRSLSARNPGRLILLRINDDFESMGQSALDLAAATGLTITHKRGIPWCGCTLLAAYSVVFHQ